jgi:hypothetical protein
VIIKFRNKTDIYNNNAKNSLSDFPGIFQAFYIGFGYTGLKD